MGPWGRLAAPASLLDARTMTLPMPENPDFSLPQHDTKHYYPESVFPMTEKYFTLPKR
jgi:hypothetical protein